MKCEKCGAEWNSNISKKNNKCPFCGEFVTDITPYKTVTDALSMITDRFGKEIYLEENKVWVKVEIQVRTMAMDFWANLEHDVKYKTNSKLSKKDSGLLKIYAKIISKINKKMVKMYRNNYQCIENEI